MTQTTEPTVDFSKRRVDTTTSILRGLKPGESYIHDHSPFETSFTAWIATRRSRLQRKFKSSHTDEAGMPLPSGFYRIFIDDTPTPL